MRLVRSSPTRPSVLAAAAPDTRPVPPDGHPDRVKGVYLDKRTGHWYSPKIYDPDHPSAGPDGCYPATRDTYWEVADLKRAGDIRRAEERAGKVHAAKPGPKLRTVDGIRLPTPQLDVPIADMIDRYCTEKPDMAYSTEDLLRTISKEVSGPVSGITPQWCQTWCEKLKTTPTRLGKQPVPSTIKKKVEALRRCHDWYLKAVTIELSKHHPMAAIQVVVPQRSPLHLLGEDYFMYAKAHVVKVDGKALPQPKNRLRNARTRRLHPGEADRIVDTLRGVLRDDDGDTWPKRKRKGAAEAFITPSERIELELMFFLFINTAMRLRECYTLQKWQVDLVARKIMLPEDKTKTAAAREVPMLPDVLERVKFYMQSPLGPKGPNDYVFSWMRGEALKLSTLKRVTAKLSKLFTDAFAFAGSPDLTEHDLRHQGTYCLVMKKDKDGHWLFPEMEAAEITGHKDMNTFKSYANFRGEDSTARIYTALGVK